MEETERERIKAIMADCIRCQEHPQAGRRFEVAEQGVHYGKIVCKECGRFLRWVPKPDSSTRRRVKQEAGHWYFEQRGIDFCEACLRPRAALPKGITLTVHHIVEVAGGDGPDQQDNWLLLCSTCHQVIHALREGRQIHWADIRPRGDTPQAA